MLVEMQSLWKSCFINTKLAAGTPKVLSKEFLEGCLRCMATMCFASPHVLQGLNTLSTAPLRALYQHTSPKIQERACQLTAALAMDDAACSSFVPDGVRGLLDLCNSSVAAPVREQACYALCQIARSSPGCHACIHLQTLGASKTLLQLLKGASTHGNTRAEEHAALLLCRMLQTQPHAAAQVREADGLQTIMALLPAPYAEPSAFDAAAAATIIANIGAAPAWSNKPQSSRLQSRVLQLFAAVLQSVVVRSSIFSTDSSPSSMVCLSVLLNLLNPDAPPLLVAPPVAVPPAVGKGAMGKADGKAKAGGKGKAEAVPPLAAVPPPELLPPFPSAVQLPAVQCLQELAKEPAFVTLLLNSPLFKQLAKVAVSATDQLAQQIALLVQYMALNTTPEQLPAADIKPIMRSLAGQSLKSDDRFLQAAVGSAACSLPPSLLLPDVKPPLPSPPCTPPPPPLPLSKFIWDAMGYEKLPDQQSAAVV
ncbi:TPA: hypothetical protein ACH3X1_012086 [Trebouxia sp. C0004]